MSGKYELHSLLEIFDSGRRGFQIPDYQRGYSWESQQVKDLIKDLEHSSMIGMRHFGGTIVAAESALGQKNVYDIVDGQQRLTTMIILLRTLYKQKNVLLWKDRDGNDLDIYKTFIMDESKVGNTLRLFKLNRETDNFFLENILKDNLSPIPGRNKSHSNLLNTKSIIEKWLKPKDIDESKRVLDVLINNFGFLFYAPRNTSETGLMFEVINNRGKRLSQLDKVKNYLIYYAAKGGFTDLSEKVNAEWGNNLLYLNDAGITSNEDEDSFLRNCYLVFFNPTKKDSYAVYERLKEEFPSDLPAAEKANTVKRLLSFVDFLGKSTLAYRKLVTQMDVDDAEERDPLLKLSLQATIASVTPLLLSVFSREKDVRSRVKIFGLVEKLNFRYYGCHIASRADSGQGDLFYWAHHYFDNYGTDVDGAIIDSVWLENKLIEFVRQNAADKNFVEALTLDKDESGDYYDWQSLKYFLANYEEKLQKDFQRTADLKAMLVKKDNGDLNDAYDKEHIWARADTIYIDDSKDDMRNINKRRLGNFALLEPSINRSVSESTIKEKVDSYFAEARPDIPNTKMLRELRQMYDDAVTEIDKIRKNKTWRYWEELYSMFFDKREEKIINFALERWCVYHGSGSIKKVSIDSLSGSNQIFQSI